MSRNLLEPRIPLDPGLATLLRDIDELLGNLGIPYLLTGAMARELLLHYAHGCAPGRRTTDVDFGVALRCWEDFETLKTDLSRTGRFHADPKAAQRMIHHVPGIVPRTVIDLVPFGSIANPDGKLVWPPDGSVVMRVLGYAQALPHAVHLRIDDQHAVPIASAPSLVCMKLTAWMDRGETTQNRDAVDVLELLHQYAHVLTVEELYDDHPEAMERYGFHEEPAAAYILGCQVAAMADTPLGHVIDQALLPQHRQRMLDSFLRERSSVDSEERLPMARGLIDAFCDGYCHKLL